MSIIHMVLTMRHFVAPVTARRFLLSHQKISRIDRKKVIGKASFSSLLSNETLSTTFCSPAVHNFMTERKGLQTHFFSQKATKNENEDNETKRVSKVTSLKLDSLEASSRWRKDQLSRVTKKFGETLTEEDQFGSEEDELEQMNNDTKEVEDENLDVRSDEDLQPMWRAMESRVLNKKSMTLLQARDKRIPTGRRGVRRTDEEAWLEAGLYDENVKEK